MTPICFIDTETTGIHPDRKVWDVAMIRRDDSGQFERQFFVEVDLSNADPFGLAIGRFYKRHPMGRRLSQLPVDHADDIEHLTRPQAASEVAIWTHGAHLVGAVPNFDAETLDPLLRDHGLIPAWHYHLIDVEALAVGWIHANSPAIGLQPPALPWKSDDLSRQLAVQPPSDEERHTALGDARWAMRMYDAIVGPPAEPADLGEGDDGP